MKKLVKICGIKTYKSAKSVVENGGDFIGFNFVKTSKRYIEPEKAYKIIKKIKGKINIVGIFKDQQIDEVNSIAESVMLDYVQLHGNESKDYCKRVNTRVIKTFSLEPHFDIKKVIHEMKSYSVDYYLVDRKQQGKGEMLEAERLKNLCESLPLKTFIAGGLTSENVTAIVEKVKPMGVDVSGGVRTNGKEDEEKIKQFIYNSKYVF